MNKIMKTIGLASLVTSLWCGCATVQNQSIQNLPIDKIKERMVAKYNSCVGVGEGTSPILQLAKDIADHRARVNYLNLCKGKQEGTLYGVAIVDRYLVEENRTYTFISVAAEW